MRAQKRPPPLWGVRFWARASSVAGTRRPAPPRWGRVVIKPQRIKFTCTSNFKIETLKKHRDRQTRFLGTYIGFNSLNLVGYLGTRTTNLNLEFLVTNTHFYLGTIEYRMV